MDRFVSAERSALPGKYEMEEKAEKIKVALADSQVIFCEGLKALLDTGDNYKVCSINRNGVNLIESVREHRPEVVIIGVDLHEINGIEATHLIKEEFPLVKIAVMAVNINIGAMNEILLAGASAYLLKTNNFSELESALNNIIEGKRYLCPQIAGLVVEDFQNINESADGGCSNSLTAREKEVLKLIADGHSSRETAEILDIGFKTVESYRRKIMKKVGADSEASLTKYALRQGFTAIDRK